MTTTTQPIADIERTPGICDECGAPCESPNLICAACDAEWAAEEEAERHNAGAPTMHALVQVQGDLAPGRHRAVAAGLVDGPRVFRRAVDHALRQGYTVLRVERVHPDHTRRSYGFATLVRKDAAGAVHVRTVSVELHAWDAERAHDIARLYASLADPIAPFIA